MCVPEGNVCSISGVSLWVVCMAFVWHLWGFCVCNVCIIVWCMSDVCVCGMCVLSICGVLVRRH